jgi:hypothetical protein
VAALPDLVQIHEQFKEHGVVFVSLTPEPPMLLPEIQALADAHPGVTWPIGYDAEPTLAKLDWDRALPMYYLFDQRGKLVWSSHWHDDLEDELVRLVAK